MANLFKKNMDILTGIGIVFIIIMMVIPLPPLLLDVLLTLNITGAIIILLLSIFTKDALDFSVLPSLILVMTLFRLSLNVSTTRLVLLDGFAGNVIQQFGEFVVGGNAVVGFIVFSILVIVNFLVITKGSERVSEVGARFTLDAMPGKQMAIDADLNSGMITEQQARERRKAIQQEADFYGAMDGSSKFVKGDAIAAIIILFINIIGGFISGVALKGMPLMDALHTYTLLTIGDGLVSQIPALLISTATGLIVTKTTSESNLASNISTQVFQNSKVLFITAGVLIALALMGLPRVPLFLIAFILIGIGLFIQQEKKIQPEEEDNLTAKIDESKSPEAILHSLHVDQIELDVGYGLISLVDVEQGGNLLDRIMLIRKQIAAELGFVVPVIRVRDDMNLRPNQYMIKLRGNEIGSGELMPEYFLAIGSVLAEDIPGIPGKDPAFGLEGKWISEAYKEEAELSGMTVVDASTVLTTHITELLKDNAAEILSRQDVKTRLDTLKEYSPSVVDEVTGLFTMAQIQKVLMNLLKERVSIKDLETILESLGSYGNSSKDMDKLTEFVRQALSRQIMKSVMLGKSDVLNVITLDPYLEQQILENIQSTEFGAYLSLEPKTIQSLLENIMQTAHDAVVQGYSPIILCAPIVRINLKRITEKTMPQLTVLSYNEMISGIKINAIGNIATCS